jgi:hypothetical protein
MLTDVNPYYNPYNIPIAVPYTPAIPVQSSTFQPYISTAPSQSVETEAIPVTGRFVLLEQPNETQRKSYKNENRCISPNPLVVMIRPGQETDVLSGTVVTRIGT